MTKLSFTYVGWQTNSNLAMDRVPFLYRISLAYPYRRYGRDYELDQKGSTQVLLLSSRPWSYTHIRSFELILRITEQES